MEEGGITTVLGANGAGKTTMLRAISAMVKTRGAIRFGGKPIDAKATEQIVAMGSRMCRRAAAPSWISPWRKNLRIGMFARAGQAPRRARHGPRVRALSPSSASGAGSMRALLSGGEQQMLAVARALMLGPRLLLLDEPSLGLAPLVVREIFRILRAINKESGVSILLVVAERLARPRPRRPCVPARDRPRGAVGHLGRPQEGRRHSPVLPGVLRSAWTSSCSR
jgi:branched-chain amino acid transport system ATP-binding protein